MFAVCVKEDSFTVPKQSGRVFPNHSEYFSKQLARSRKAKTGGTKSMAMVLFSRGSLQQEGNYFI